MAIRVLIADDHAVLRAGLVGLLCGTEFEVIALAADCDQLVRYALTCNPDVVLADLRLADGNSLEAIKEIKTKQPTVRVLILTMADSIPAMIRAHELGADGYVLKTADSGTLMKMLRGVMRGKRGWNRRQLQQIGTARRRQYGADILTGLTCAKGKYSAKSRRASATRKSPRNWPLTWKRPSSTSRPCWASWGSRTEPRPPSGHCGTRRWGHDNVVTCGGWASILVRCRPVPGLRTRLHPLPPAAVFLDQPGGIGFAKSRSLRRVATL